MLTTGADATVSFPCTYTACFCISIEVCEAEEQARKAHVARIEANAGRTSAIWFPRSVRETPFRLLIFLQGR
jgi:hypothetical protein